MAQAKPLLPPCFSIVTLFGSGIHISAVPMTSENQIGLLRVLYCSLTISRSLCEHPLLQEIVCTRSSLGMPPCSSPLDDQPILAFAFIAGLGSIQASAFSLVVLVSKPLKSSVQHRPTSHSTVYLPSLYLRYLRSFLAIYVSTLTMAIFQAQTSDVSDLHGSAACLVRNPARFSCSQRKSVTKLLYIFCFSKLEQYTFAFRLADRRYFSVCRFWIELTPNDEQHVSISFCVGGFDNPYVDLILPAIFRVFLVLLRILRSVMVWTGG